MRGRRDSERPSERVLILTACILGSQDKLDIDYWEGAVSVDRSANTVKFH